MPLSRIEQDHAAYANNLKKLPGLCYHFRQMMPRGKRIAAIRAGERGFYETTHDQKEYTDTDAAQLVIFMNDRLQVASHVQRAMVAGALFGFHVPSADPDHPHNQDAFNALSTEVA